MASFHLSASSSSETPIILNPLEWNRLYSATTFGFSILQGLHHDAQKSISVTFPNDSFNEISLPEGDFPEKSGAIFTSLIVLVELAGSVLSFFLLTQLHPIAF